MSSGNCSRYLFVVVTQYRFVEYGFSPRWLASSCLLNAWIFQAPSVIRVVFPPAAVVITLITRSLSMRNSG